MMLQDVFAEDLSRIVSTENALSKSTRVRTRECLKLVVFVSLTTSGTTPSTNVTFGLGGSNRLSWISDRPITEQRNSPRVYKVHTFIADSHTHLTWFFFGICLASFFSE